MVCRPANHPVGLQHNHRTSGKIERTSASSLFTLGELEIEENSAKGASWEFPTALSLLTSRLATAHEHRISRPLSRTTFVAWLPTAVRPPAVTPRSISREIKNWINRFSPCRQSQSARSVPDCTIHLRHPHEEHLLYIRRTLTLYG